MAVRHILAGVFGPLALGSFVGANERRLEYRLTGENYAREGW